MTASIASAWVALRRRSVFWTALLGTVGFAVLSTVVSFASSTEVATEAVGPAPPGVTIAELSEASGIVYGLVNSTTLTGVIAIAIAATAFGGDFANGTVRTLLVRQPHRLKFLAGKMLAIAGLLVVCALVATVASAAVAYGMAGAKGVDTSAWSASQALLGWLRISASMVGFAALGGALGLLLRSPVAAIAIGVGWALAFELLVTSAWDSATELLPAGLLGAVADGTVTLAQSGTLGLWLAAVVGAAAWTFLRRDVRI